MWECVVREHFIDKKNLMAFIWPLQKIHLGHISFYKGELNPNIVHKGALKRQQYIIEPSLTF